MLSTKTKNKIIIENFPKNRSPYCVKGGPDLRFVQCMSFNTCIHDPYMYMYVNIRNYRGKDLH